MTTPDEKPEPDERLAQILAAGMQHDGIPMTWILGTEEPTLQRALEICNVIPAGGKNDA